MPSAPTAQISLAPCYALSLLWLPHPRREPVRPRSAPVGSRPGAASRRSQLRLQSSRVGTEPVGRTGGSLALADAV